MGTLHAISDVSDLHVRRKVPFLGSVVLIVIAASATALCATVSFSGTSYNTLSPNGVVSADLNRDGWPDIAVAGDAAGQPAIAVLLATGPGSYGAATNYPVPPDGFNDVDSILSADFNGDGELDLIVSRTAAPRLDILWNNGDGTFHSGPTLNLSDPATSFDVGDFNIDGLLDIAVTECNLSFPISCSLKVYVGKGNGAFTELQSVHLAGFANHLRVADMNGDSKLDLVISRTTQVLLWWGKGDGTFSAPSYLTPAGTDDVKSFAIGDFDNDRRLDVVVDTGTNLSAFMGCLGGSASFYKNVGGNNFSLLWSGIGGCADLDPIDMNGDRNEDLIFHNGHPDAGFWVGALGKGDGTFRSQTVSGFSFFPNPAGFINAVYVRDLNLDSRDDYVVGFQSNNETMVALQTGGFNNCAPPSSAKLTVKICTPAVGSSISSPVLVRASGNSPAGVIQLQVWVDGIKKAVKWHDELARKFTLAPGTHRLTVVATDRYLGTAKKSVDVTIP